MDELNHQKQRLCQNRQIKIGKRTILNKEQFTIQDQALNTHLCDLEKTKKRFDEDLKIAKEKQNRIINKIDTAQGKRKYKDKTVKLNIFTVF